MKRRDDVIERVYVAYRRRSSKQIRKNAGTFFVPASSPKAMGETRDGKAFRLHMARTNQNTFDDFRCQPVELAGAFLADLFPTFGVRLHFLRFYHRLNGLEPVFGQHPAHRMLCATANNCCGLALRRRQDDHIGQTLQQ